MPSTSPGSNAPTTPTPFKQTLPGKPVAGLQSLTTFAHRHKRYVAYISGRQLNILSSPTALLQAVSFGELLVSVTAEPKSGKLAIATKDAAWVLEPVTEGWTKIWWERALFLRKGDPGDEPRWLSWGGDGELLVGGTRHLCLFSTVPSSRSSSPAVAPSDGGEAVEERRSLWSKAVSSPVRWAAFSPSANLIATCGARDRLVKIWRRLSFEEGLFDHTYLPHPGAVTHLQWRPLEEGFEERRGSGKSGRHDDDPEVLHTIANDGVLRVWKTGGIHDLNILVLHTTVDLVSTIPQSPSLTIKASAPVPAAKSTRYAFTIPAFLFTAAVKAAIGLQAPDTKLSHSLEHLKEVSTKDPDIIVTLDGHGRMSAWGLQSIGHKRRPETPSGLSKQPFHIAHCEDFPATFLEAENAAFEVWYDDAVLNVLTHGFNGEVRWWKGETEAFFSPAAGGKERLVEQGLWSGLADEVIGLQALPAGEDHIDLVTYGPGGEASRWTAAASSPLRREWSLEIPDSIVNAVPVHGSSHVVTLEGSEPWLVLRGSDGSRLASEQLNSGRDQLSSCRLLSTAPTKQAPSTSQRFVVLGTDQDGRGKGRTFTIFNGGNAFISIVRFDFEAQSDGEGLRLQAILDAEQPDRFGVVGLNHRGQLLLHHVEVPEGGVHAEPILMATFESNVRSAYTWTASNDFAALASEKGDELTVIDLRDGHLEHHQKMEDPIRHLCAATKENMLAVGHERFVDILAQGRYGEDGVHPTWHHIRQISVAGTGLSVNGLAWLGDGGLAVATGNGMFIASQDIPVQELQLEIREALDLDKKELKDVGGQELCKGLQRPHPAWHPRVLIHLVHCGRWQLAASLVARLLEKLKFWSEGDHLDSHLQVPAEQLYGERSLQHEKTLDADLVNELHEQLDEKNLPQLSSAEQAHLRRVLNVMLFCAEHVRGLDDCALRFLFAWRLAVLDVTEAESPQTNGTLPNGVPKELPAPQVHWREIAFAHQSTTQQPLLDILTLAYDNKISWRTARNLGLFAWLSDREALSQIFEALAQSAYRVSSPPDPIDASLYFLALHKKSTLLGLWRIATWHKEQKATMNFLRRDFEVEANRTAARKNAYALMGKRRFEYAAAFFLLAEDAPSATSLMAGQCGDVMLAIAVARLYAGDGSSVLRKLVEDRLLPDAEKAGNRWQASWCHSILFERKQAAEALVKPLEGVRKWDTDDPHTLTLYKQLRMTESEWEWEAVLRAARLLRKMGLWFAALELVRGWQFQDPRETALAQRKAEPAQTNGVTESQELPSMLDEFASPVSATSQPPSMLDDFAAPAPPKRKQEPPSMLDGFGDSAPAPQDEKAAREAKAAELLAKMKAKKEVKADAMDEKQKEKRQPTQFKEPSADSLLDSFGF